MQRPVVVHTRSSSSKLLLLVVVSCCLLALTRLRRAEADPVAVAPHADVQQLLSRARRLAAATSQCNLLPHTELGGSVVKWGAHHKVDNATACCDACAAHNRQGHRHNCTSWVWNHDAKSTQHRECWLKRHADPWSDMSLLQGVARSWHGGIVGVPRPLAAFTTRSCRGPVSTAGAETAQLFTHAANRAHGDERSLCPPVRAAEAELQLLTPVGGVRLRLNRQGSPRAVAWMEELLSSGVCTGDNRTRCKPYCCQIYRGEAAVGVNTLDAERLRRYQLDPSAPPHWGRDFFWGPPYGFLQGRLWNAPSAPKGPKLPAEASQAVLHRGTVELVGEGPDFLIALGDHPLMPPHNAFAHVVEEDMKLLDSIVEANPVRIEPWWPNSSIFTSAVEFELRRIRP